MGLGWDWDGMVMVIGMVIGLLRAPKVQLEEHAAHYADTVPQKTSYKSKPRGFE